VKKFILCLLLIFIYSCNQQLLINKDYLPIVKSKDFTKESYQFIARGGERHLSQIDWGEESIPTSSKSCHHGGEIIPPLKGFIMARYDDKNIYLKIIWKDLTKDNKNSIWKANKVIEGKDDGISIIFASDLAFNCALTCHMSDWEIDRGKFVSDYRMYNEKEENPIILIRSAKTAGKAIYGMLGKEGKKNPDGSEFFVMNSRNGYKKKSSFYLYQILGKDDDTPFFKDEKLFILNPNNCYLESAMNYRLNQWTAHITIPLSFLGLKEIKKDDKIYLALAIFDGTHINHSITNTILAKFE